MYHIDSYDNSLVIDGFQNGIADSPYEGISDMRNVNIVSVPGEASVNLITSKISLSFSGTVVSADSGADTITVTQSGILFTNGQVIVFTGASLPAGVTAATKYMIGNVSGSTFQIFISYATYISNSPVNITSTGTGTYASVAMDTPTQRCFDKLTNGYYFLDKSGRVWYTDNSANTVIYLLGVDATTTTAANGNGIVAYGGYIFVFRNALIDYMKISTGVWTYAWQTMVTSSGTNNSHYALVGLNDNIVYYCDSNYIGSFYQKDSSSTFDPSDTATYTWNQKALGLPSIDIAQCLVELGTNLLIGGQLNAIYPWNRVAQVSGKSINNGYSYPILLAENFVARMVTVNTNTYILAGQRGRIYITNGSQASLFKKVPDHISGTTEPFFEWGDAVSIKNQLYFGIKAKNSVTSGAINQYGGLWAVDLDKKAIRLTNKLSYATYSGIVTALLPIVANVTGTPPFPGLLSGAGIYIGWDSGASTYGIDYSGGVPYTSSESTIDTDLIAIGTYDKPRDLTRIEYKLSRPLVSGESITIKYRLIFNTSDTGYTTVLTDSTAGNYSSSGPVNFMNAQWVQFQIVLNSTASSPSYVRLREMRILGLK